MMLVDALEEMHDAGGCVGRDEGCWWMHWSRCMMLVDVLEEMDDAGGFVGGDG